MSLFITTGGKGLKFQNPGDTHTGTVSRAPREQQQTKFGSQEPDTWPNGDPKMQVVVELDTAERDPADGNDDGSRTLYVSSSAMKRAIGDAIIAAGAEDIEVGGILTVTFTGFDPTSKNPQNPKKLYQAGYARPTSPLAPQGQPAAAGQPPIQAYVGNPAAAAQQAAWNQAPQAAPGQQDVWNPTTPPGAQGGGFPGQPAQPQFAPTPAAAPQAGQQQFAGQGMPAPAPAPAPAAPPAPAPAAASSSLTGLPVDVENKLQQLMQVLPPEQILPLMAGDGVTQQHIDQLSSF
ncbi:hypothetical protein [Pseudoclavibacter sp. JSM 162008]|uniref:hypothetical protein n=1 Tax=Pseudoclavibacter sp. JSM 162008 TaxID=3229855 RepID=UPI003524B6C0